MYQLHGKHPCMTSCWQCTTIKQYTYHMPMHTLLSMHTSYNNQLHCKHHGSYPLSMHTRYGCQLHCTYSIFIDQLRHINTAKHPSAAKQTHIDHLLLQCHIVHTTFLKQ
jgi:hypothetical protein